jgi:hypothetical protein
MKPGDSCHRGARVLTFNRVLALLARGWAWSDDALQGPVLCSPRRRTRFRCRLGRGHWLVSPVVDFQLLKLNDP